MGKHGKNIRNRADGRWEARVVKGRPVGGKTNYKYLYGKTYEEVVSKKAEFLHMLANREGLLPGRDRRGSSFCL